MKKDRDMMYYGMGTYSMMPYQIPNPYQNIEQTQTQEIENRLNRIERQIRKIDARLTRIESPYPDTPNYKSTSNQDYSFTSDNSMYMM